MYNTAFSKGRVLLVIELYCKPVIPYITADGEKPVKMGPICAHPVLKCFQTVV